MADGWHLAQVNVALPREPLDSPALAEFVALLDPVNALADTAPGFVWRLQDESGDATAIRVFDDERFVINMSVWEDFDALWQYVYSGGHLSVMRRRREWMSRIAEAHLALWWVPAGHRPNRGEAAARLELLRARGPSPEAFTFKHSYPSPGGSEGAARVDDRDLCPAGRSPHRSGGRVGRRAPLGPGQTLRRHLVRRG